MEFLLLLKKQSALLYWFGWANFALALLLIVFSCIWPVVFQGLSAWHKPIKFALSIGILVWTVARMEVYLPPGKDLSGANLILFLSLLFEIIYISFQAARGQASHFNLSTPLHQFLYSLMALAASAASLTVAYLGIKFFSASFPALPTAFLWSLRLGIILFVVFSFAGFAMGARLSHNVGELTGPHHPRLPFLGWSLRLGDLRIAHFLGMHALQILPLLGWYLLKDTRLVFLAFGLYALLAGALFLQALAGKPLISL
jgi:hypothetical protein